MALIAPSLSDRARRIRSEPAGERVEGRRPRHDVSGAWGPARLIVTPAPEKVEDGRATVLERGGLVVRESDVVSSDRFEVDVRGERQVWRVAGAVERAITRRMGSVSLIPVERLRESPTP